MSPARGPVLVVHNEFPKRSETFLFRELVAWREQGLDVRPLSLLPAARDLPSEMAPWRRETLYLHQLASLGAIASLLRETLAALASPVAAWQDARRGGRLRDAVAGWAAGVVLTRLCRRLGVRRLHAAWGNVPAEAALRASRRLGLPYTVSVHAVDLWCHTPPSAPRLAEAEAVFVCNRQAAAALVEGNPALEPRVRLIPHGVAVERFPLADRKPGPPWRLLAVGRLVPKKGLDLLIAVCDRLRARDCDFECRIVGEGPLARELARRIRASGLDACVHLAGPSDQAGVAEAMAQSHVLLGTWRVAADGDREGLPNVLLEALLTGLPVVATRTGSVEELLHDGVNGRLVEVDDAEAMAAAVLQVTGEYAQALERGRAGRQHVLARLSGEDQAAALARVFAAPDRARLEASSRA